MTYLISSDPIKFTAYEQVGAAFLLALYGTGIFAFLGFAYPTHRILPASYYSIKNPQALKLWYRKLGLKYFKSILLIMFWGKEKNRKKYFNGTKKGIANFIFQTKQSEFGHLGALILIMAGSIALLYHHYFLLVAVITLLNIIGNLYPIILQRYHRIRIERLTL